MRFFINGTFTTQQNALLPVLDLGLIRGYGVFDYLRTYQNRPFHLQDHLKRLRFSAKEIGLDLPYTFTEIQNIINTLLQDSPHEEHSIKILLTGNCSQDQILPDNQASFIAFSYPLKKPPASYYTQGVKVITTKHARPFPQSKTTNYLGAIVALKTGAKTGAVEALYLNDKEQILEGTTSNFFAFRDGELLTPPENGILLGITRAVVLKLCENLFPIKIRTLSTEDLPYLEEAFLTSSTREVMPITYIDGKPVNNGVVGPATQTIMNSFASYTKLPFWAPLSICRYEQEMRISAHV